MWQHYSHFFILIPIINSVAVYNLSGEYDRKCDTKMAQGSGDAGLEI